jgi:hypothetical protein
MWPRVKCAFLVLPALNLYRECRPSRLKSAKIMNADRRAHAVEVVSADPLLAALIGAAVELAGYRAAFPRPQEGEMEAFRRIRPIALLLDAAHTGARDEAVLGRALMSGTRIVLFGSSADMQRNGALITRYEIAPLVLPAEIERLPAILGQSHPLMRSPRIERR